MLPKDTLKKDMFAEFTLNKSFNTYKGRVLKADFNSPLEGVVVVNRKDQIYFYPLLALHMIKPTNCFPTNVIPKTSLPVNPKNIHIKEALSRIVGRTVKIFYENPKTSYLGRLLGFTRGCFSWSLVMEIHGEIYIFLNPDYMMYYGTVWKFLKNNPPYERPKLMNITKTAQYLKRCLLEDVKIESSYPRINIDNKVFVYPYGVVGEDDYLKETVMEILKEKEFLS
ncbi:hypothetical protein ACPB8Q_00905 [Methanocaldococcus indicus]|uniref:hypothetical protein n=1 Tax=Methanocaldococcus indicus TaxID=213231 RepID=UPI003C6D4D53